LYLRASEAQLSLSDTGSARTGEWPLPDSITQPERTKIAACARDDSRLESKDSITTFFFTD
jgi:hypothetical protein